MQPKQPLEFYSEALPDVDTRELQGTLIVIEGPDAVGRSTQVARLRMWLQRHGHPALATSLARRPRTRRGLPESQKSNTFPPRAITPLPPPHFPHRPATA